MKIIVTGSTSFIGRAVILKLTEYGHEVTALRHSFDETPELLPGNADAWVHFAWGGVGSAGRSDPDIQSSNVEMTMKALKKAEELGCSRFVFAGSQAEYGHAQDGILKTEAGAAEPVSEYGRAKLEVLRQAEKHTAKHLHGNAGDGTMSYIHLRIFSVYGPGDHETSLISTLLRSFGNGEKVRLGPCSQMWNYMYIEDAAAAIACIIEHGSAGIYNVAGNENIRLSDYVERVRNIAGNGSTEYGVRPDNAEGAADLCADISRLTALGFRQTVTFEEGIRRMHRKA